MEITKLLALLQVPQLGSQKIGRLLSEVDFTAFCNYDREQLRQIGWNEKQIQRWFNPDWRWIDTALAWAEKPQQHLISLFDVEYPFLLRQISTAPPILFVKGQTEVLSMPQIAIVGSRDYSHYGEYWAGYFAGELVKNQIAVTSGLAIGIDGFCHQKALAENGITIAVLGSGLDQVYPSRHKKLAENIVAKGGALVSEFFPNQPPLAENFPRRNRIISGLSLGTLVVEATLNSGSLITARYALEQGREVFALPNSVQNPYSQGCHKLIKDGALLVESIDDILEAIVYQRQDSVMNRVAQPSLFTTEQAVSSTQKFTHLPAPALLAKNLPNLTACQQQLLAQIGLEPISIDDLAKACEMSIDNALIELLNLELLDVIKQVSGGYVRC
ncbi:DNA-processing protein DprA [Ursidibacter sp. B-7004-1]